jgi:hypothetical protein
MDCPIGSWLLALEGFGGFAWLACLGGLARQADMEKPLGMILGAWGGFAGRLLGFRLGRGP